MGWRSIIKFKSSYVIESIDWSFWYYFKKGWGLNKKPKNLLIDLWLQQKAVKIFSFFMYQA